MRCKWNKKQLLALKEIALKTKDEVTLENLDMMLEIMDDDLNLDKFNIVPEKEKTSYKDAYELFTSNVEYLTEDLIDTSMDIFKIEDEFDWFLSEDEITKFDISNKDLITIGYDCLAELRAKKLLKIYTQIIDDKKHYLHMTRNSCPSGIKSTLGGITFYNYNNKKNYICVYRTDTAYDFQTLIHETLHAYFYKLYPPGKRGIKYFQELEGRLGNELAINYLNKIGYPTLSDELNISDLKGVLTDSYHVYLNDLLFGESNGKNFNLGRAARVYEQELNDKWLYKRDDISEICSIYGFDVITDLISYLIIKDLFAYCNNKSDILENVRRLKQNDSLEVMMQLDKLGLTFMNDNFKNVNDVRLELKKKGY